MWLCWIARARRERLGWRQGGLYVTLGAWGPGRVKRTSASRPSNESNERKQKKRGIARAALLPSQATGYPDDEKVTKTIHRKNVKVLSSIESIPVHQILGW